MRNKLTATGGGREIINASRAALTAIIHRLGMLRFPRGN